MSDFRLATDIYCVLAECLKIIMNKHLKTFDHFLLLGRPAAGKSEFIDFMQKTSVEERAQKYHIGRLESLDDFFWLWEKFLEDDEWEEAGCKRIFSEKVAGNYGVLQDKTCLYDLMFAKFNHKIKENYLSKPEFYNDGTLIIEFARGRENAYKNALSRLSKDILERAVILYVDVDFEESWRRNIARYEEKKKASSLSHMAPRELMERVYKIDDWKNITSGEGSGYLDLQGIKVPFVTMNNIPELKERGPLSERYGPALAKLYDLTTSR